MRLFLYYSLHSTWNQLRRLFKTWVFLLLLALVLGGGLIGLGAMRFSGTMQAEQDPSGSVIPEDFMEYFEASQLTKTDAVELGAGLLILSVLTIQLISAEKSFAGLFLPADVNILFASDMTPQAVLSFRLMTTLGTAAAASIYLFFQLPSLVNMLAATNFAAGMIILSWCFTIAFSLLFKTLLYEIGGRKRVIRENLRYVIFLFLSLLAAAFYYFYRTSKEQLFLLSAHRFFNAPVTRWIPVWGWLKGMIGFALEGDVRNALILCLLCELLILILAALVRFLPADYYEEASIRSEETALFMEALNSDAAGLLVTKSRKRSSRLERDGFHYGRGASVYFFRPIYNRLRFAFFHIVSKTMITYLFTAAAGGMFSRLFMDEPSVYPPVFFLAVIVFFRTIISPMSEDIRRDSFILIPENTWKKLFCSLLGGTVVSAMDSVLPLMLGTLIAVGNPFAGLLFLPLILSVDCFATTAGTFVDVSIPSSVDRTFKQVIQILLLYFGMIPDEMIIAFGFISHHPIAGLVTAGCVNLALGAVFFGLSGVWLNPSRGMAVKPKGAYPAKAEAKAACSRIGMAMLGLYAGVSLVQRLLTGLSAELNNSLLYTLSAYLPIYVIGILIMVLVCGSMRRETGQEKELSSFQLAAVLPVCFFVMYAGNLIGLILTPVLSGIVPYHFSSPIISSEINYAVSAVCIVLCSPLAEEFIFRRMVIDRLRPYGETCALAVSAVLFGLFHGNLTQFCYGGLLGIVFGYVYLKTGRLRYSVLLHMTINLMGAVIAPLLVGRAAAVLPHKPLYEIHLSEVILQPEFMILLLYLILLIGLSLLGMVLFANAVKDRDLSVNGLPLKDAFASSGILLFVCVMVIVILGTL